MQKPTEKSLKTVFILCLIHVNVQASQWRSLASVYLLANLYFVQVLWEPVSGTCQVTHIMPERPMKSESNTELLSPVLACVGSKQLPRKGLTIIPMVHNVVLFQLDRHVELVTASGGWYPSTSTSCTQLCSGGEESVPVWWTHYRRGFWCFVLSGHWWEMTITYQILGRFIDELIFMDPGYQNANEPNAHQLYWKRFTLIMYI